jgi:hypothetical protein
MAKADMAAGLAYDLVADRLEGLHGLPTRNPRQQGHGLLADSNLAHELTRGVRDGLTALAHVLDGQQDRFPSVGQGLFDRLSLAVAAGQSGNHGHVPTIRVRLEKDVIL